jgi:DNA primase
VAVEGYTDVLALHQGGISESVAIMGTALTQQQLSAFAKRVGKGTVYLALDADRAGQEAMLRAARGAQDLTLELRVVEMPEGQDPAELVSADGPDAFEQRLEDARVVPDFEARRLVRTTKLNTPHDRDQLLQRVWPLVSELPETSATREELIRFLDNELDVPAANLYAAFDKPPAQSVPEARQSIPPPTPAAEAVARAEQEFLVMCLASADAGREYMDRLEDEHFTSETVRLARRHLSAHWDDPLGSLPESDPALAALVTELVMRAQDADPSPELLRLTFFQLESRRLDRQIRHATRDEDFERLRALWPARESVRARIDELMGQTT